MKHFASWVIRTFYAWEYCNILGQKNQTRKFVKIHEDFEIYQIFMYNFLCRTVLIFAICVIHKRIDTISFGSVSRIQVLPYFEPKIHMDFELHKVFMYNCLCQTVLIFPIYIKSTQFDLEAINYLVYQIGNCN